MVIAMKSGMKPNSICMIIGTFTHSSDNINSSKRSQHNLRQARIRLQLLLFIRVHAINAVPHTL